MELLQQKQELQEQELRINSDALKDVHRADASGDFSESVLAVANIVQYKMYRCLNMSLEDYFRSKFGVSRAQVYRLLDCAQILSDLQVPMNHEFVLQPYPIRQRVAKTIKDLASTRYERQMLWHTVLSRVRTSQLGQISVVEINSKEVRKAWVYLCRENKPQQCVSPLCQSYQMNRPISRTMRHNARNNWNPYRRPSAKAKQSRLDTLADCCAMLHTKIKKEQILPPTPTSSPNQDVILPPIDYMFSIADKSQARLFLQ